ncbi:SDR family NAD(P)-dependent oxidoreductase [Actinoplanes sp. LDG1-06]|uniref:SDR family NAD(P)-dependent oxidoreductase n=1 Tax=Paractinoplanes ovalisporus TaxID=2810368 RepID=A0ABS2ATK5_9ACTN|nr:SDR family NAD(P)-dependent oxidoreductase [Actinoplanes ovalisporus]MBM2622718.1 SDR family NAD(P)-dependent oxidoreductase [Actinoplanes ovalisporus]
MQDRTVIITGGNTGLGYQAARNLAADFHVVLACRSASRGAAAAEALKNETGNPNVRVMTLDLAALDSVRVFHDEFTRAGLPPLHAIVCNAGISAAGMPGVTRTADDLEPIFAVNHLGHFLLTNLLLDHMKSGRIVFVTSDLHNPPPFFPARVTYRDAATIAQGRSGMPQYCLSKLCNLYCTYEMARRLTEAGRPITVNAFNPGAMSDTGFSRPTGNVLTRSAVRLIGGVMGALIGKQSTAATSGVALAALVTDPRFATVSGRYFDRGEETKSSPLSYNRANARDLWQHSLTLTGLTASATPPALPSATPPALPPALLPATPPALPPA